MLGYHACGDPQGQTILYFHGFPGSRLEVKLVEPVAGRMGMRIIGISSIGWLWTTLPSRTSSGLF
jgi:hypothetical protein